MKQFPDATKPFCRACANVPKPLTCTGMGQRNTELATSRSGRNRGRQMHKLNAFSRSAAFAAFAIGAIAFSGQAAAAPQAQLFPFFLIPPTQYAPPPAVEEATPAPDTRGAFELPARLRRQVVSYQTREAPGTIIIDTPNTYLYLVLGGGQAMRYGIGVGRDGFTWSGIQSISKKAEWPDWVPPPEMIA